jgi:hypothetical protein
LCLWLGSKLEDDWRRETVCTCLSPLSSLSPPFLSHISLFILLSFSTQTLSLAHSSSLAMSESPKQLIQRLLDAGRGAEVMQAMSESGFAPPIHPKAVRYQTAVQIIHKMEESKYSHVGVSVESIDKEGNTKVTVQFIPHRDTKKCQIDLSE